MSDAVLIFGYGSLINAESRKRTLRLRPGQVDLCVRATVHPEFGYRRSWCFRSATGFTALGLEPCRTPGAVHDAEAGPAVGPADNIAGTPAPHPIPGVVHAVGGSLDDFDARETGYRRVQIPASVISFDDADDPEGVRLRAAVDTGKCAIYTYIPMSSAIQRASEDFPICQTYLDTVMEGCLDLGGEAMAERFVQTTSKWSEFFLDDTPTSRRPWLHRRHYVEIDGILERYAELTKLKQRKHPEEFASEFLTTLRGLWGAPARNPRFCGREKELSTLETALARGGGEQRTGISRLHVIGLGGVGKSQLVTEFLHRHYGSKYGLVIWINAESEEDVIASLRQLAADAGLAITDKNDTEVIEEVKARLYRTQCSWLMVYDNVESGSVVERFLPRGAASGHVLITCRRMHPGWEVSSLILGCFEPADAIRFLNRAAGESAGLAAPCEGMRSPVSSQVADFRSNQSMNRNEGYGTRGGAVTVGALLAERLGHLPLALAVAASCMQRYDLDAEEYLNKLDRTSHRAVHSADKTADYDLSLSESISLSLNQMNRESSVARHTLNVLSFVAPDGISRPLVIAIVCTVMRFRSRKSGARKEDDGCVEPSGSSILPQLALWRQLLPATGVAGVVCVALFLMQWRKLLRRTTAIRRIGLAIAFASIMASILKRGSPFGTYVFNRQLNVGCNPRNKRRANSPNAAELISGASAAAECAFVEALGPPLLSDASDVADDVWSVLKSFSTITVRSKVASVHRMLQQVVHDTMSVLDADDALCCCLIALKDAWHFLHWDPSTWTEAGHLVPHIIIATGRGDERDLMPCTRAALLTTTGVYLSVALSRFEKAERLLRKALEIYEKAGFRDSVEWACTLHHYGKVTRYVGDFAAAERALQSAHTALDMILETALDKALEERVKLTLAATLHERGMVKLKQRDLDSAALYLQQSLHHKHVLTSTSPVDPLLSHRLRVDATLYQLGVIATVCRPPRLDDAERLLRQVLEKQRGEGAAFAATLQQLGRVAIRRGDVGEAEKLLHQALVEFTKTYRSSLHVNVAAVHNRLGSVYTTLKRYDNAREHLSEALRIQQYLYESGSHVDVAVTLHELGKACRAEQSNADALNYFRQEQVVLEHLLCGRDGAAAQLEDVLQKLATSWRAIRAIGKDTAEKHVVKEASESLKAVKERMRQMGSPDDCKADCCGDFSDATNAFFVTCLEARTQVREELSLSGGQIGELNDRRLGEIGATVRSALELYTKESEDDVDGGTIRAIREFVSILETPAASPNSHADLYQCCDDIRAALRKNGVEVSD